MTDYESLYPHTASDMSNMDTRDDPSHASRIADHFILNQHVERKRRFGETVAMNVKEITRTEGRKEAQAYIDGLKVSQKLENFHNMSHDMDYNLITIDEPDRTNIYHRSDFCRYINGESVFCCPTCGAPSEAEHGIMDSHCDIHWLSYGNSLVIMGHQGIPMVLNKAPESPYIKKDKNGNSWVDHTGGQSEFPLDLKTDHHGHLSEEDVEDIHCYGYVFDEEIEAKDNPLFYPLLVLGGVILWGIAFVAIS